MGECKSTNRIMLSQSLFECSLTQYLLHLLQFGIYRELGVPKDSITSTFSEDNILSIKTGALASMGVILGAFVLRVILAVICCRRAAPATDDGASESPLSEDGRSHATSESTKTGFFSKFSRGSKSSHQKTAGTESAVPDV